MLDLQSLERACRGRSFVGSRLEYREVVASTSELAWELAGLDAPEGTIVAASRQERGRGRHGRTWFSPVGGLYVSLLLRPGDDELRRAPPTLLGALALAEAIERTCGAAPAIEWPNDVLLSGRKVAGILGEMRRPKAGQVTLVLGIGVNVDIAAEAFPEDVAGRATSLALALGAAPSFEALARELFSSFEAHYLSVRAGGGALSLSHLSTRMPMLGRRVRVRRGAETIEGVAAGLSASGGLVVEGEGGLRQVLSAGEVLSVEEARGGPDG